MGSIAMSLVGDPEPSGELALRSPGPATPEAQLHARATADAPSDLEVDTVDGHQRNRPRVSVGLPSRVGRYVILRRLGEGGMGVVLEAFDPELDRKVAIKLLHPSRVGAQASQRLLREAQVMARLDHPNVVTVHDAGIADQRVFLAMELVRGRTVRAWLEAKPRSWREIVAVFVEGGRGLAAAHAAGIIHRDFKPENMLVADDAPEGRRVRVADFGLANFDASASASGRTSKHAQLTATGAVVGTPVYMAPEQHAGVPLDAAADQFSFCVALHEALFGQRPFAGDSAIEIAANVCEGRYLPPAVPGRAPRWLAQVIRRGLAVDPRARHASFDALLAALARDPAARMRKGAAVLLAGALTLGGGWALAARDSPCDGAREHIAAVWSDDARAGVQRALGDASKTIAALDRYAEGWATTHDEMCEAHQDGAISGALLDGAMGCLARREAALAQLVETVGQGGAALDVAAPVAAVALPAIASCSDRTALAEVVAPPDAAIAADVDALRRRLVEAEVVHRLGEVEAARESVGEARAEAERLGYRPLVAEVALTDGRLALERLEWNDARARFESAAALGIAEGMDGVVAEALARELFVDAMMEGAVDRVLARAPFVAGVVQRAGDAPALAALLANHVGVAQGLAGDAESAARSFARAVELGEESRDVNAVDLAGYRINLAIHTDDPQRRDAIFVAAARELGDALGDGHPKLVEIAQQRAEHTADPRRARELLAPVCATLQTRAAAHPLACNVCDWRLAELHDELGESREAIAASTAASACLVTDPDPVELEYVQARRAATRGLQAVLQQEPATALVDLAQARVALAAHRELPWIAIDLAGVLVLEGRALAQLDRRDDARAKLDEAIAIYEQHGASTRDPAVPARLAAARMLRAR